jgi:hypothetical protein
MSYSQLVWSGVKDLFNVFLHYLNIIFTIVGTEMHPEGKEQHLKMKRAFQQYGDRDSGVRLAILGNQY